MINWILKQYWPYPVLPDNRTDTYRCCYWEYNTEGDCQSNIPIYICYITFIYPFTTLPQARTPWCVDCESLSQETCSSSHSTPPAWSPQQTFQELLAAVVSSQWPRNTSKHLCVVQIPKILLSRDIKISSMLLWHLLCYSYQVLCAFF